MPTEREILTWELFGAASRDLAQEVADSGYRPDLILSIARGGLFVAGALGYALDVKNLHVMNVEFYTGVDERLDLPVMLPPVPNAIDLSGAKVLVADDVADTGATLKPSPRLLRRPRRGRPLRGHLRKAPFDRQMRICLAPHRPLDQFPVVDRTPGGNAPHPRRLTYPQNAILMR